MNFLSYIVFIAANMAFVVFIPKVAANQFLSNYSFSSFVFGILTVYLFSSQNKTIHIKYLVGAISLIGLSLFLFLKIRSIGYIYASSLVLCDYALTQSKMFSATIAYRIISAILILPMLLFNSEYVFHFVVLCRISISLVFLLIALLMVEEFENLTLKSPGAYILGTHLCYYGVLLLLPTLLVGEVLKAWYIAVQIVGNVILKINDYRMRAGGQIEIHYLICAYLSCFLALLTCNYIYQNNFVLLLSSCFMVALIFLSKVLVR